MRVYGTEQFDTPTQINPAHPSAAYDLISTFLTEFRFTQATLILSEIKARINRIIANKLGVDIGFDI